MAFTAVNSQLGVYVPNDHLDVNTNTTVFYNLSHNVVDAGRNAMSRNIETLRAMHLVYSTDYTRNVGLGIFVGIPNNITDTATAFTYLQGLINGALGGVGIDLSTLASATYGQIVTISGNQVYQLVFDKFYTYLDSALPAPTDFMQPIMDYVRKVHDVVLFLFSGVYPTDTLYRDVAQPFSIALSGLSQLFSTKSFLHSADGYAGIANYDGLAGVSVASTPTIYVDNDPLFADLSRFQYIHAFRPFYGGTELFDRAETSGSNELNYVRYAELPANSVAPFTQGPAFINILDPYDTATHNITLPANLLTNMVIAFTTGAAYTQGGLFKQAFGDTYLLLSGKRVDLGTTVGVTYNAGPTPYLEASLLSPGVELPAPAPHRPDYIRLNLISGQPVTTVYEIIRWTCIKALCGQGFFDVTSLNTAVL